MMYEYRATVSRVVDGDTYDLWVDLGLCVATRIRVRLLGIDTPEIYHASCPAEKEHGQQAKTFAVEHALGRSVIVRTHKDKRGKYGRWLAEIVLPDGTSLAELLRANGFEKREVY